MSARARAPRSALSLAQATKLRKDALACGELEVPLAGTLQADRLLSGPAPPRDLGAPEITVLSGSGGQVWEARRNAPEAGEGGGGFALNLRRWGPEALAAGDAQLEGVAAASPVVPRNPLSPGVGTLGCCLPTGEGTPRRAALAEL